MSRTTCNCPSAACYGRHGNVRGPRFRGTVTRVAEWCGRELAPGVFEPSHLDHVDARREVDGVIVATYRGQVIEVSEGETWATITDAQILALLEDKERPLSGDGRLVALNALTRDPKYSESELAWCAKQWNERAQLAPGRPVA